MRTRKHLFFIILSLWMFFSNADALLPKAEAAAVMSASKSCIEFIKDVEGFSAKPYYDYSQHTVGYGTKCPTDKYFDYMVDGIPEKEAEALLLDTVADIGDTIHKKLMEPYGLTFSQNQFDALVSFSFNLGTSWMTYDSTLRNALLRNATEDELVYAFVLYCTAGGNYSTGLVSRRLYEANMFLNGVYSQTKNDSYGYVYYEPNGGSLTYQVQGFVCNNHTVPIAEAVRTGDVFLGWYTELTSGTRVTELNRSLNGKTLFARWQSGENSQYQDVQSMMIQVTGDVVNIRKGPGTNYGISKQVYRNDTLIVSHVTYLSNRHWGKVDEGWICLDYTNYNDILSENKDADNESSKQPSDEITDTAPPPPQEDPEKDNTNGQDIILGIVQVNDLLRIRSGPGTVYATVGYLFDGNILEILEQKSASGRNWGRIDRGWVCMDYILTASQDSGRPVEPESEQEADSDHNSWKGKIIADALRIRSNPGTGYPIVGFYYQDEVVSIYERTLVDSVYWGKTDQGWINLDYVATDSPKEDSSTSAGERIMTVTADCLRVRKEIGTDSRISALLYYGDTVTVFGTETVDGTVWGRVEKGWICMDYVS